VELNIFIFYCFVCLNSAVKKGLANQEKTEVDWRSTRRLKEYQQLATPYFDRINSFQSWSK